MTDQLLMKAAPARFSRTLIRLTCELRALRYDWAAFKASRSAIPANLFVQAARSSVQSDLLIRLIRVFENSKRVSCFWYLHRTRASEFPETAEIEKLRKFSCRLKRIRDKVFVHIDKEAVFDPTEAYRCAGIQIGDDNDEIAFAIGYVWCALKRLKSPELTEHPDPADDVSLDSLRKDLERDFRELLGDADDE